MSSRSWKILMETPGLEEPFWYIIISTGGTFIILATTVLVFVLCRYQQDKNAHVYESSQYNNEAVYSSGTLKSSNKNDLWCRQEVELRMKTPDDFLVQTTKDDVLPLSNFSYGTKPHPDGTATLPTRHRMNTKQWCQEQRAHEQGIAGYSTLRKVPNESTKKYMLANAECSRVERAPPINMESSAGSKRLADSVEKNYHELVLAHRENDSHKNGMQMKASSTKATDEPDYGIFIIQI